MQIGRIESLENSNAMNKIVEIPFSELFPYKNHPFKVLDDENMAALTESIQERGVLVPAIVRPRQTGGFEIIAGHRRWHACELAGRHFLPAIVCDLDDDAATIVMVDSNIQRESLLPSERAYAYKMKLDAMKHQGRRTDLTSDQVGQKLERQESRDVLAAQFGQSRSQITRYIRLTELIPQLLEMVDDHRIAFNPAVELSYLSYLEQAELLEAMESEQATPSLSQAQRLKRFAQAGRLSMDVMCAILSEEKKSDLDRVVLNHDTLKKYFPSSYTPRQMEETILQLLERWQQRQRNNRMK